MISWTPEFCTVCDKQCLLGSVYCSERCREADIHKAGEQPDSVRPHAPGATFVEQETSESSDDDDEVPSLCLTHHSGPAFDAKASLGSVASAGLRSKPVAAKGAGHFLYVSPTLKPSKVPTVSPAMSPLMIPVTSTPTTGDDDHMSSQSVNTYKRWLAHGAV